jgi:hypothetical protein
MADVTRKAVESWAGSSLASSITVGSIAQAKRSALEVGAPLSTVLPEGGFPRGSVVELMSPANLGHGVSVALAACAASQETSVRGGGEMAWCAFLDPDQTLFGPAVQASGVCLERLLVVRPPRHLLAKVAVRVALSRIFSVIVVDVAAVPGATSSKQHRFEEMDAWSKVTRRLALAVEKAPTILFLLTRAEAHRSSALPVAMRVELENGEDQSLLVRVAKDRLGRVTHPHKIAWKRPPGAPRANVG